MGTPNPVQLPMQKAQDQKLDTAAGSNACQGLRPQDLTYNSCINNVVSLLKKISDQQWKANWSISFSGFPLVMDVDIFFHLLLKINVWDRNLIHLQIPVSTTKILSNYITTFQTFPYKFMKNPKEMLF